MNPENLDFLSAVKTALGANLVRHDRSLAIRAHEQDSLF